MVKKVLVVLLAIMVVWSLAFAIDLKKAHKPGEVKKKFKRIGFIAPDGTNLQLNHKRIISSPLKNLGVKPGKALSDAQPVKTVPTVKGLPSTQSFVDYIQYFDWPPDAGFIFGPTDSVAVWFRPVTQCSLLSVLIIFHDAAVGHTYNIEVRRVAPHLDGVYDFRYGTEDGGQDMTQFDQNWTGRLMGSYALAVPAANQWIEIPVDAFGFAPEDKDLGLHDFAVMWQFPEDTDPNGAELWADLPTPFNHHGFKWYHNGHPSLNGAVGWVARYNFSIIAKVLYYGDPPPVIKNMNDWADQYNSINPGPYEVHATVTDLGTDVFHGYVRRVALIMDNDDDPYNAPNDTVWVYDDQPGGTELDSVDVSYDIPNPGVGNSVYYWWYAEDNGAENAADTTAKTHVTVSQKFHFTVREKNPNANILLVDDSGGQGLVSQYTSALDAFGYVYDLWDTEDGDSTSLDILSLYPTVIWFTGTANGGWFDALTETQIAPYLDNGGNLFFSSSDFVGIREGFSGDQWTTWTTPSDPFVVNYLKVDQILDDANATRGDIGMSSDTLYKGIPGTLTEALVDSFEADMADYGYYDWSGEVLPAEGTTVLQVFSEDIGDWDETAGYIYQGTYNLVYLPWCFESIHDINVRMELLSDFLGGVFGENAAPVFANFDGSRYSVVGNGPFPVTIDVWDNDGSVTSVELGYSIDGGDWTWIPMQPTQGGNIQANMQTYTAEIPALTPQDTSVAYTVRATDDMGTTRYHTEVFWFERVDFSIDNPGGLLVVSDDPYEWWHGVNLDHYLTNVLDAMGVNYDFWDSDALGMMDSKTVLNNYHTVMWVGYADWDPVMPFSSHDNTLSEFLDNGGNLFFSSEEMLGTWTNWTDVDFSPGDFPYDYLGVQWVGNDFGYDTLNTKIDPSAAAITDGLDTLVYLHNIGPFDIFSDLVDPRGYPDNITAKLPFFGWLTQYGMYYYAGVAYDNVVFLPFCAAMLDSTDRATLFNNVLNYFGTPVSISKERVTIPKEFAISQNYPNPFNPVTHFSIDIPKTSKVKLVVYNMLGQKVRTLVDKQMEPGRYRITWDGRDDSGAKVASGVYFYRFETPTLVTSKKMVLLK